MNIPILSASAFAGLVLGGILATATRSPSVSNDLAPESTGQSSQADQITDPPTTQTTSVVTQSSDDEKSSTTLVVETGTSEAAVPIPATETSVPEEIAVEEPSGLSCDPIAAERAGRRLELLERLSSQRFRIEICTDDSGQLWYHGARIGGDPVIDTITLAANRVTGGYLASTEAGDEYAVINSRIVVTTPNGTIVLDEGLTRTYP